MKVFISWSDETSHAIALALGDWISTVIQAVETYVSPEDIRKGTGWVDDVPKELDQYSLGILCVIPGNIGAPWLNFEAGALSKSLDVSKVIPLLIDVEKSELANGPLAQLPSAIFERNDMYQILEAINEKTEKGGLSKERLHATFEIWWPKLEVDVESIKKIGIDELQEADQPERTPDIDKPEKTPDTDKPKKTPKRTVEAARKSEAIKTQDAEKPAKPVAAKPAPEEIEIEMLTVLYDPPGYASRTADAVGFKLDISAQKAREHLDKLERNNYVREHLFVGRPKEYSLAPKGREYLTKNDLLKKRRDR